MELNGGLPTTWQLRHSRNGRFVGFAQVLDNLRAVLEASGSAVLVGDSSSGKTQVAVEYAFRFAHCYDLVSFIRAANPSQCAADYVRAASSLGLPEKNSFDQPEIVIAVRNWLSHNSRWLLIFDDVSEASEVSEYIPRQPNGHVIFTSETRGLPEEVSALQIPPLDRESSLTLWRNDGAFLCGQPHALSLAGGSQSADYLERVSVYLSQGFPPLDAAILVSLDLTNEMRPEAMEVMRLLSWLAPDSTPVSLLEAVFKDSVALGGNLDYLATKSLISVESSWIRTPKAVQRVLRDSLPREQQDHWAGIAISLVNTKLPSRTEDYRYWPAFSRLMIHCYAAADHAERLGIRMEDAARILNQIGLYELRRGQIARAERLLTRTVEMGVHAWGPDHLTIATYRGNLAMVLHQLGNLDGAQLHLEHALRIDRQRPEHIGTAARLGNLSQVLQARGDIESAYRLAALAFEIGERIQGANHAGFVVRANNMAQVSIARGDLDTALRFSQQALESSVKVFGGDHPRVATFLGRVAGILADLDELPQAIQLVRRALRINERFYAPGHWKIRNSSERLEALVAADAVKCAR